ncbi:MAG: radical SAM protein [Verrucomicrobiales bacterium]
MTAASPTVRRQGGRRALAEARLGAARASLSHCTFCLHRCAVDRRFGPAGKCGAGAHPRVFSAQTEVGDELDLIPCFAIALAGCSIRCAFCVTGDESWHADRGSVMDTGALAGRAVRAIESGAAKTIQILGGEPTVHLPWLIELVARLPENTRIILKTNGLCTARTRRLLDGLIDVWLVDFKFGGDGCARTLSRTRGYRAAVEETLFWAARRADLIVRHLVMPGHVDCCWRPIATWLARHLPGVRISLRFGYWPSWKAAARPEMAHPLTVAEQEAAAAIAAAHHLNLVA